MKILVFATICFAAIIAPANAQNGVPNSGANGVSNSAPPLPTHVKVFTVKRGADDHEWICDQGSIQSLLAVYEADDKNVPVVFLDQAKNDIKPDIWASAYGFRFEQKPEDDVRVTMFCGG